MLRRSFVAMAEILFSEIKKRVHGDAVDPFVVYFDASSCIMKPGDIRFLDFYMASGWCLTSTMNFLVEMVGNLCCILSPRHWETRRARFRKMEAFEP